MSKPGRPPVTPRNKSRTPGQGSDFIEASERPERKFSAHRQNAATAMKRVQLRLHREIITDWLAIVEPEEPRLRPAQLMAALQSGEILCRVANRVFPKEKSVRIMPVDVSAPVATTPVTASKFRPRANAEQFLALCDRAKVNPSTKFEPDDLVDRRNEFRVLNHIISLILHQKETKHPPSLRQVPEVEKLVQGEGVTEPALSAEAQAEISQALSANRLETVHPPTDKGTYNLGAGEVYIRSLAPAPAPNGAVDEGPGEREVRVRLSAAAWVPLKQYVTEVLQFDPSKAGVTPPTDSPTHPSRGRHAPHSVPWADDLLGAPRRLDLDESESLERSTATGGDLGGDVNSGESGSESNQSVDTLEESRRDADHAIALLHELEGGIDADLTPGKPAWKLEAEERALAAATAAVSGGGGDDNDDASVVPSQHPPVLARAAVHSVPADPYPSSLDHEDDTLDSVEPPTYHEPGSVPHHYLEVRPDGAEQSSQGETTGGETTDDEQMPPPPEDQWETVGLQHGGDPPDNEVPHSITVTETASDQGIQALDPSLLPPPPPETSTATATTAAGPSSDDVSREESDDDISEIARVLGPTRTLDVHNIAESDQLHDMVARLHDTQAGEPRTTSTAGVDARNVAESYALHDLAAQYHDIPLGEPLEPTTVSTGGVDARNVTESYALHDLAAQYHDLPIGEPLEPTTVSTITTQDNGPLQYSPDYPPRESRQTQSLSPSGDSGRSGKRVSIADPPHSPEEAPVNTDVDRFELSTLQGDGPSNTTGVTAQPTTTTSTSTSGQQRGSPPYVPSTRRAGFPEDATLWDEAHHIDASVSALGQSIEAIPVPDGAQVSTPRRPPQPHQSTAPTVTCEDKDLNDTADDMMATLKSKLDALRNACDLDDPPPLPHPIPHPPRTPTTVTASPRRVAPPTQPPVTRVRRVRVVKKVTIVHRSISAAQFAMPPRETTPWSVTHPAPGIETRTMTMYRHLRY